MRKYVLLLLAGLCVQLGHGQPTTGSGAAVSTLTILPEDVVQESIRLFPSNNTNQFLLILDYSERGVRTGSSLIQGKEFCAMQKECGTLMSR